MSALGDIFRAVAGREDPSGAADVLRLRKGTVDSVAGGGAQVALGASAVAVPAIVPAHVSAAPGATVWCLTQGPVVIVLGVDPR